MTSPRRNTVLGMIVALWLVAPTAQAALPEPEFMARVESLLAEGQAAAALSVMREREPELAGNPQFDYLLGLAALDAGQPELAVTALERVLAAAPRFAGARIELAKAHLAAGHKDIARAQFQAILADNPAAGTRIAVERYLAQIEQRDPRDLSESQLSWFVDVGGGYDSNANGSTNETQFLGFTLSPLDVAQASPFGEMGLGVSWSQKPAAAQGVSAYGRFAHRGHSDAGFLDQSVVSGGVAYQFSLGKTRVIAGASGYRGWLNYRQHQVAGNVELSVARFLSPRVEVAALVRGGVARFDQPGFDVLDGTRYLGGVAVTRYGLRDGKLRVGVALLGGRDEARLPSSPFSNERAGARLYGSLAVKSQALLYGELLYLDTRYQGSTFFGRRRIDRQWQGFLGLDVQDWPRKGWAVSPQLRVTDNRSTLRLYQYDRVEGVLFLRRLFR